MEQFHSVQINVAKGGAVWVGSLTSIAKSWFATGIDSENSHGKRANNLGALTTECHHEEVVGQLGSARG